MVSIRQSESSPSSLAPVSPRTRSRRSPSTSEDATAGVNRGSFARRTSQIAWILLALSLTTAGTVACDSCNRDRPYVPFKVESSLPSKAPLESVSAAPSTSAEPPPPAVLIEARRIEPPSGRLEVAGKTIELPKKTLADWSLEQDFTGDGQLDALVWVRPETTDKDFAEPLGSLWFFPTGGDAQRLWTLPGWVPTGEGCNLEPHLQGLGKGFVWVQVQARCQGSLPQRSPTRLALLLAPTASRPLVFGLRVAEPAVGESLAITPQLADRDGDGRVDPALSFEMTVADTAAIAKAELGWLDRTAGLSVDDDHFSTQLEPTLLAWDKRTSTKAKATGLTRETEALRRLIDSLCQQAATPRVWDYQGDALRCPGLATLGIRLARIEVKSAIALNDVGLSLRSLSLGSSWLYSLPAVEREGLRKLIDKQFALVKASLPLPVSVRPKPSNGQLRYSPLRFEDDGTLTVINDQNGLQRVAVDGSVSLVDADADTPWPLEVVAPDGRKWSSLVPACDRSELLLAFVTPNGSLAPLAPTTLLAPRPGVCRNPTTWPINVAPIAWTDTLPTAIVDSVCLDARGSAICQSPVKLGPVLAGSPRSPDGRRLVFVSPLGPIVYGGSKPERWENALFDSSPLTDCVVSNDALAIACLQQGKLLFSLRPSATP